ncbi:hypothetical protein BLNAU_15119 [Blattamonas nauphoetae]|uniref:Uncharacterized protein n=1 Tax=Blattamonas nauphoetae TaxID=2049346 RepID=A0ABQ9XI72_9EUKA|nr:hypothetical protein BLNAU_15119 [Blattamonas nauphoetae]
MRNATIHNIKPSSKSIVNNRSTIFFVHISALLMNRPNPPLTIFNCSRTDVIPHPHQSSLLIGGVTRKTKPGERASARYFRMASHDNKLSQKKDIQCLTSIPFSTIENPAFQQMRLSDIKLGQRFPSVDARDLIKLKTRQTLRTQTLTFSHSLKLLPPADNTIQVSLTVDAAWVADAIDLVSPAFHLTDSESQFLKLVHVFLAPLRATITFLEASNVGSLLALAYSLSTDGRKAWNGSQ